MRKKIYIFIITVIVTMCIVAFINNNKETVKTNENNTIEYYIPNYEDVYRDSGKVKIDVLDSNINMVKILITDSNDSKFGYTYSFRIERKTNGKWQELYKIYDDQYFYNTLYDFNEKNQLTIELDCKKYYGTLESGTYRIIKPVYSVGYFLIDLYSNEFEIE